MRREQRRHRRRHVEVEDLLHEPHRRLVRRGVDDERRARRTSRAAMPRRSGTSRWSRQHGSLAHHRRERPERQRDEDRIKEYQHRQPGLGERRGSARRRRSPPCPARRAMITGTRDRIQQTGSSTSRDCARTSIAANSVPTAAKPIVPAREQRQRAARARGRAARRTGAPTTGTSTSSTPAMQRSAAPSSLPR